MVESLTEEEMVLVCLADLILQLQLKGTDNEGTEK